MLLFQIQPPPGDLRNGADIFAVTMREEEYLAPLIYALRAVVCAV